MSQRLILLGGSGFIGQSLLRWLNENRAPKKYRTVVFDPNPPKFFQPDLYLRGRIADLGKLKRLINPHDLVIHLVHTTIPSDSMDAPGLEFKENFQPAVRLMEMLKDKNISGLVYFSTGGTIYGEPEKRKPIREDAPRRPNSFYGLSKLLIEDAVMMAGRMGWFQYLILRPANPYGPWQEQLNRHGAIGRIFQALPDDKKFSLFGKGDTVRDYIYVDDLSAGLTRLIEKGAWDQIYNIGTGKGTGLLRLIRLCERVSGQKLKRDFRPIRGTDLKYNVLDGSRLKRLGWKPKTGLEAGLEKTWEYFLGKNK